MAYGKPNMTPEQIRKACNLSDDQVRTKVASVLPTPSTHQMKIFRFFLEQLEKYLLGEENVLSLLVKAVAGSGKTTTIVALAYLIPTQLNAIFLAFNKPIADELKTRLPQHVEAKTINSLGWNISKRYADAEAGHKIAFKDFTNQFKINNLMRDMYDRDTMKEYGTDVRWLVGMCQNIGIVPSGMHNVVAANGADDSDATFDKLLAHYDRRVDGYARPVVYRMTREVLTKTLSIITQISFDEQKYFPVVKRDNGKRWAPWKKFDIVIIDEVQDTNAVDLALIKLVLKANGIVLGVGDNRQSIYGFRGADVDATEKFKATFNAHELPLTVTWRCGRVIVELARSIYPEIEAAPNAHEGLIAHHNDYDDKLFNADGDDLIICRNNAPIVTFAYKLISRGVPVFVKGRDIGRGLLSLIEKLGSTSVTGLASDLKVWQAKQIDIALEQNPDDEAAIQSIGDKVDTIMVFVNNAANDSIDALKADIERMFSVRTKEADDEKLMQGKVVLSTIHKAKGLEAERVFFLDSNLMMPRWITPGTWQEVQENNLRYVAVTRPKNELHFINSKKMK